MTGSVQINSSLVDLLASTAIFGNLSPDKVEILLSLAEVSQVLGGEVLIRQGDRADCLYFVASGRFEVKLDGHSDALTEIGLGEPVGELAFFTDGVRTANVTAVRDSVVIALDRPAFDEAQRRIPELQHALLSALARRITETTARVTSRRRFTPARTIAVIRGGGAPIPAAFYDRLRTAFAGAGHCLFLSPRTIAEQFPDRRLEGPGLADWLNTIERQYDLVVYLAEDETDVWTRTAIRQADQVLIVGYGSDTELNPLERTAFSSHPPTRRRLVLLHDRRQSHVPGIERWLRDREVALHHHVALQDDIDFRSLYRFITSTAVGYVAGGGGGYGPAHMGIMKAFQERNVVFDMVGGSSVGAAMMAGFAILLTPEEVDLATADIFVTSRAFEQRTIPRYAFLDHTRLDAALQRSYHGASIEGAWRPYYAIATDVDRPGHGPYVMRRGPLWKAVRASGSLPAILPPVLSEDGRLLVDGGVVDNVPVQTMMDLKQGPNLVVNFANAAPGKYDYVYESIPGRAALLRAMLTPLGMRRMPKAPGPLSILRRCIGIHQNADLLPLGPQDLLLTPPEFLGSSLLSFGRHSDIFHAAYDWCRGQIDELSRNGDPGLAAILKAT